MRLAIVGSRSFEDFALLSEHVTALNPCAIVSGGAAGADTLAANWARTHNVGLTEFLPDYDRHGRGAPLVRNKLIVEAADMVLAFWDGKSKGTKHSISHANKLGIRVEIVMV